MFRSRSLLVSCALAAMAMASPVARGQVVISQIFGGAGSTGATYNRDYIELFNRGPVAVDLSTWSVQYASVASTTWTRTNLTGTIPAGGYFLIYGATGTGTSAIPIAADTTGTLSLSTTTGRLALVANQSALGAQYFFTPGQSGVVDFVAYGVASSSIYGYEGDGPTGTNLSATTAAFRKNGGCTDTNDNSQDFDPPAAPSPRNSMSSLNDCSAFAPSGACCLSNATCVYTTPSSCAGLSGASYIGDYVPCAAGTYTVTNSAQPLIDISTTGTLIPGGTAGSSHLSTATALPFAVNYFGQTYNTWRATSTGYLTFCQSYNSSNASNNVFPTTAAPLAFAAPCWDAFTDVASSVGRVYYETIGSAPNRQFVVMWRNLPPATGGGTPFVDGNYFEVIVNEPSQVIEFRYGAITAQGATYTNGTAVASFNVGLEGMSSADGVNIDPVSIGTGGDAAALQFTPTGQCPAVWGCCRGGSCFAATALSCVVGGGVYAGDGVACGAADCSAGACCTPDGLCVDGVTAGQCATLGGLYQGTNSTCGAVTCPAIGSCCTGTSCAITFDQSHGQCTAGTWTIAGSCTPNNCGGACCNTTTNVCSLATDASACGVANTFSGVGTTCAANPCPAPVNDDCTGAINIPTSSLGTTILGGNGSATNETGTYPTCTISTTTSGVWYTFTPSLSRVYTASTCNALTQSNTSIRVFTLAAGASNCSNQLQCVGGNSNDTACTDSPNLGATVQFCGASGATYYILITVDSGVKGQFGLTLSDTGLVCPDNDVCSNAVSITIGSSTPGTLVNASIAGQPTTSCNSITPSKVGVWYTFTEGPTPHRLSANLCDPATDFDAMIFLYTGSCPSLTCVWGNDTNGTGCPIQAASQDNGQSAHTYTPAILNWTAGQPASKCTSPNTTYYLLVTVSSATANPLQVPGSFVLHLDQVADFCEGAAPPNNACAGALPLTSFPTWRVTFRGDAAQGDDPAHHPSCADPASTIAHGPVWYSFSPTEPGNFFHARLPDQGASGTSGDTVATVYSAAPDCSSLTEVACVDAVEGYTSPPFTTPVLHMNAGTSYYIMVSNYNATVALPGIETLGFNFVADNGACCNGTTCTITPGSVACTTAGGTFQGYASTCASDPCSGAGGVCCRGATCSTAFADATACAVALDTTSATVQSKFVSTSSVCNTPATTPGMLGNTTSPCCYANFNHNATLEVQDIFDFLNDWFAGKKSALVGGDGTTGTLSVQNIFDFLNAWFAGGCT